MRIKIIEPGWDGYTGQLGTLHFEDGISTTSPSQRERDYFGVVIRIAEVNQDGSEGEVISANADLIRIDKLEMPVHVPILKTDEEREAENPTPVVPAPDPMQSIVAPAEPAKRYTRDELEAIADKEGIKGLRGIGAPLGAKNTSIIKLIDEILEAQAKAAK